MRNNLLERSREELLTHAVYSEETELLISNPSEETVRDLVRVLSETDDRPQVKILGHPETLKTVMDDFIVASTAADLLASGDLMLRESHNVGTNPLVVSSKIVITIVDLERSVGGLFTDDEAFVEVTQTEYAKLWDSADEYALRTPPLSAVNDGLGETLNKDAEQDFQAMLDSLETARGNGDGLDEVTISLLAAAKNEALLYDISKWGEDTGVASKATFSRMKTTLEEHGLIETEKVPIDVGRPRLRLTLGDDRLRTADNDQLATVAQSLLT